MQYIACLHLTRLASLQTPHRCSPTRSFALTDRLSTNTSVRAEHLQLQRRLGHTQGVCLLCCITLLEACFEKACDGMWGGIAQLSMQWEDIEEPVGLRFVHEQYSARKQGEYPETLQTLPAGRHEQQRGPSFHFPVRRRLCRLQACPISAPCLHGLLPFSFLLLRQSLWAVWGALWNLNCCQRSSACRFMSE